MLPRLAGPVLPSAVLGAEEGGEGAGERRGGGTEEGGKKGGERRRRAEGGRRDCEGRGIEEGKSKEGD